VLSTLGDHIKKRRLDLQLFQKDVARRIEVNKATVVNWERHGREPGLRHIPKIIEYLGYVPFACPEDPIGRLKHFKLVNGLSYERLGGLMGRDPEQLTDWLGGRIKPLARNLREIEKFLEEKTKT
jgi:transcriptional regulator with XRE-family HTH domain